MMPDTAAVQSERKVPVGVDPTRASIARVYDAFLGGKDNYAVDREVLRGVQKAAPEAQELATENRGFLIRACRFLAGQAGITHFLAADIFEPREILDNQTVRQYIDFTEPLALLQLGTLHHFDGQRDRPAEIMREYVAALPSGSYVAISHFLDPENEHSAVARRMENMFLHSPMGSGTF